MKDMGLIVVTKNGENFYDLMIERDEGNPVRILFPKKNKRAVFRHLVGIKRFSISCY